MAKALMSLHEVTSHANRGTEDGQVIVKISGNTWSNEERKGSTLYQSCLKKCKVAATSCEQHWDSWPLEEKNSIWDQR